MKRLFGVLLTILFFGLSVQGIFAQKQDFSKITLKIIKVRGNVYMLEGKGGFAGGNIAVSAGRDGILIVDDQIAPMSAKISRALKKISRRGKLRYILNTHWHGDHTGGNSKLGKNATIIAHKNVRKRLMKKQKNFFGKSPVQPKSAWPVITFDYSLTVHFNGETIKMSHYPHGHTDGDGVVYFKKSNVLHMGDHFFNGIFPFVDLNSGGNVLSYARNVGAIIRKMPRNVIIIPGHGALSNLKELKVFHRMLIGTIQHVRKRMLAGKSLRTMQKEGLPKKWKSWGKGFIKEKVWIRFIQTSIIRKATMRKHMKPYHRHRK